MTGSEKLKQFYWEKSHRINDNGEIERKCTKCSEWIIENNNNFYFRKPKIPEMGFVPKCIICFRKDANDHRIANRDKNLIGQKIYYDKNKDKLNKGSRDWAVEHPDRNSINQSEWRQANPEKCREYSKFKAQYKSHKISIKEWNSCKQYFNNECAYCGLHISEHYFTRKRVTKNGDFHKEHYDDDGANDLSNCLPSCGSCNFKKWRINFDEWYCEENPVYSKERYNKIIKWLDEDYKLYLET